MCLFFSSKVGQGFPTFRYLQDSFCFIGCGFIRFRIFGYCCTFFTPLRNVLNFFILNENIILITDDLFLLIMIIVTILRYVFIKCSLSVFNTIVIKSYKLLIINILRYCDFAKNKSLTNHCCHLFVIFKLLSTFSNNLYIAVIRCYHRNT